jgi:hypothetical protein
MHRSDSTRPANRSLAMALAINLLLAGCAGAGSSAGPGQTGVAPSASAGSPPLGIATPNPTPPDPYAGIGIETISDVVTLDIADVIGHGDVGYLSSTSKYVWIATSEGLVRVNPDGLAIEQVDSQGRFGIDATARAVWTTTFDPGTIDRIDPVTGAIVTTTSLQGNPNAVAILGDTVWVAEHRGGAIAAFDASSGKLIGEVSVGPTGPSGPQGIAANASGIWVGIPNANAVVRVDPATHAVVARVAVTKSACGGIALQQDAVWVSTCFDDSFAIRIDPSANTLVAEIQVGGSNGGALLVDGVPWFPVGPRLVRINPATNAIDRVATFVDDGTFASFGSTAAFGYVWIGGNSGTLGGELFRVPLDALRDNP